MTAQAAGMPVGDAAPEIAVVVGAAVVLLHSLFTSRARQWVGAPLALATLATSATLVVIGTGGSPQRLSFGGSWALDGTAAAAKLIVLGATAVVVVLSPEWFRGDPRHGEYYVLVLFSALGAMVMAAATDTMELVLGVLLSSVAGYPLAAYHRRSPRAVEAGTKYFLVGALTNALLVAGVVLLFGAAGSTLYQAVAAGAATTSPAVLIAAAGLVAVGLAFKMGAVPAHWWMPDVAEGAPAPSAAFLTVVPKVGAVVAVVRLLSLLPAEAVGWRPAGAVLAAVTMTAGNLSALWQDDLRRLLGWSAVSQTGYALMALPAVGRASLAVPALLFFLVAYAAANLAAFAVVVELRGRTRLADYRGLSAARPWLAASLAVSFLSFVGIPPLVGFTGKLALFTATIDAGYGWLAVVAVANTVISLFYYLRVIGALYLHPAPAGVATLGRWAGAAVGATTTVVLVAGLAAEPLLHALTGAHLLP